MSFCPQCGAATTPEMSFCTACGRTLETVAPPPMAAPRLGGKVMRPAIALLLCIVTVGIYFLFFSWRTTREVDVAKGTRAHPLAKTGILVAIAGAALIVTAAIAITMTLLPGMIESAGPDGAITPEEQAEISAAYASSPWFLAGSAITMIGSIILYVGLWRMWTAIRADEIARGAPRPIDPRVLVGVLAVGVALQAGSSFVPAIQSFSWLGLVATLFVVYVTQDHLNRMWESPSVPPAPAPAGA